MDLRIYFLLFPVASNGYIRLNIDSKSYMDLRSYFLLFLRLLTDIGRNIDSKPYMDLRSYCLIFP